MTLHATFLVLVLAAISQTATYAEGVVGQDPVAQRYSADDFVRDMLGTHASKSDMDAPTLFAMRYANGYIAGVVDATQGGSWCSPQRLKEDELDERVWSALNERRATMAGNAAIAMLEQLNAKYPCGNKRPVIAPRLSPAAFATDFQALYRLKGNKEDPTVYRKTYVFGDPEGVAIHHERYAKGYLDGVIDATQGNGWCAPLTMKLSELRVPIVAKLDKRTWPPLANAAKELLAQLSEKFPCIDRRPR